jgi:hypothetical protein
MKSARMSSFTTGPRWLFATVGCPTPFALSLSKGLAEPVEAFVPHAGFDRLSPNGSLRTSKVTHGPTAEAQFTSSQITRGILT